MNLQVPAPPVTRTAHSRGYAISYEEAGEGFPVVLLPGYMQSAADYAEAGYLDRLAARFRVLAVDPLGHGKSAKPHDAVPYRAPGVAADVVAVLDAAGLDKAVLWGYSRGGWLACMTAIEYPQRLSGLILGGVSLAMTPSTEIPEWVAPMSRGDWQGFFSIFPIPLSAEVRSHFEAVNDPMALAAQRIGRFESAYAFHLDRVSVPRLLYQGADDDPDEVDLTARSLGTELLLLDGCDHFGAFSAVDLIMPYATQFLESVHT